jgi:hypothetical protein
MTVNAKATITITQMLKEFSWVTHSFLNVHCELPQKQHIRVRSAGYFCPPLGKTSLDQMLHMRFGVPGN